MQSEFEVGPEIGIAMAVAFAVDINIGSMFQQSHDGDDDELTWALPLP